MAKGLTRGKGELLPLAQAAIDQLRTLETEIGGRDVLLGALAVAPLNRDGKYFLGLLGDPARAGSSLLELCQEAKLLPGTVLGWIEAGLTVGSHLRAKVHIARGTPHVVADVMKRGAPFEEACGACQGIGTLPPPEPSEANPNPGPAPCDTCKGTGQLLYPADPDARKLALDLSGLLPKSGGISITNQQVALAHAGGGGDLDAFQAALDQVLYGGHGGAPPIEVDVIAAVAPADSQSPTSGEGGV